jgi:hypothetical protein
MDQGRIEIYNVTFAQSTLTFRNVSCLSANWYPRNRGIRFALSPSNAGTTHEYVNVYVHVSGEFESERSERVLRSHERR